MAAPKETAPWFPFYCADGRTLTVLQQRFELAGIGFFTNLMRILSNTPQHHLDLSDEVDRIYMYSKIGCGEELAERIISSMVQTEKLDKRLWEERKIIYCGDLIESLSGLYNKRASTPPTPDELFRRGMSCSDAESDIPQRVLTKSDAPDDHSAAERAHSDVESDIPGVVEPHSIGEDRIEQESRVQESAETDADGFQIVKSQDVDPVLVCYRDEIGKKLPSPAWPNTTKQYDDLREMTARTRELAQNSAIPDPEDFARAILDAFGKRKATEKHGFWKKASWEPSSIWRRFGDLVTDLMDSHDKQQTDGVKEESHRRMYEAN